MLLHRSHRVSGQPKERLYLTQVLMEPTDLVFVQKASSVRLVQATPTVIHARQERMGELCIAC